MLMKAIVSQAPTDRDYTRVLKNRMKLFGAAAALGVLTDVLAVIFSTGNTAYLPSFLSGVYTGVGAGLIMISILMMLRTREILKDEKKVKEQRLKEQDERNQMIAQKSLYMAGIILIFGIYIALLISGIFNMAVFWTLFIVAMSYMVIFTAISVYYNKKL